jgi:endonuclease V-like protein UPF0215 family
VCGVLLGIHKAFGVIKQEIRILGIDDGKFTPHTKGDVLIVGWFFGAAAL